MQVWKTFYQLLNLKLRILNLCTDLEIAAKFSSYFVGRGEQSQNLMLRSQLLSFLRVRQLGSLGKQLALRIAKVNRIRIWVILIISPFTSWINELFHAWRQCTRNIDWTSRVNAKNVENEWMRLKPWSWKFIAFNCEFEQIICSRNIYILNCINGSMRHENLFPPNCVTMAFNLLINE